MVIARGISPFYLKIMDAKEPDNFRNVSVADRSEPKRPTGHAVWRWHERHGLLSLQSHCRRAVGRCFVLRGKRQCLGWKESQMKRARDWVSKSAPTRYQS